MQPCVCAFLSLPLSPSLPLAPSLPLFPPLLLTHTLSPSLPPNPLKSYLRERQAPTEPRNPAAGLRYAPRLCYYASADLSLSLSLSLSLALSLTFTLFLPLSYSPGPRHLTSWSAGLQLSRGALRPALYSPKPMQPCDCASLSPSLSLFYSLTLSPSRSLSLSFTHSRSLPPSPSPSLSLLLTQALSPSLPLCLSLFYSLTLSPSLSLSVSLFYSVSPSLSLPPSYFTDILLPGAPGSN